MNLEELLSDLLRSEALMQHLRHAAAGKDVALQGVQSLLRSKGQYLQVGRSFV